MKRVLVRCYDPIAVDPTARQPWSDVWIRFTSRPGRRTYQYGPTLLSRPELRHDLRAVREDATIGESTPVSIPLLEGIDRILDASPIHVDLAGSGQGFPNVYSSAEWIDRREAERMLQALMTVLGFGRVKFVWMKTTFRLHPTTFY